MKNIVLLLCLSTAFISCNDNGHSSSTEENKHTVTTTDKEVTSLSIPFTARTYYKQFEGTIANEPVVVYLQKHDSTISGSYYYKKTGRPISINGSVNNDTLSLEENDNTAYYNNKNSNPVWKYVFNGNTLSGKWINSGTKKTFDISLKETEGAYFFEMKEFSDSMVAFDNDAKSPKAYSAYQFPWMTGDNETAGWFNNETRKMLSLEEGDLPAAIQKEDDSFFANYRKEIADLKKDYDGDDYLGSWSYDQSAVNNIQYNANGFVVIENNTYAYMGGAHGNYAGIYYNYDVANKKLLKLDDVIAIDSNSLQKILEQCFRKDYNLPESKPLTEIIFEKQLATTDNFYITEKGLGFLYNPYEIASYAQGQMEVFVPYNLLSNYFTADFKKRMNL